MGLKQLYSTLCQLLQKLWSEDLGPLRDYTCPRCSRVWTDQWMGDTPDEDRVIFVCEPCGNELGITRPLTVEKWLQAHKSGIVLKRCQRGADVMLFASLEARFKREKL